jgi:hypothetical protein
MSRCTPCRRETGVIAGREVTLVLTVASSGLVVPYERLKPSGKFGDHPSGDHSTFADAAEKLRSLLDTAFTSSVLWSEASSTWYDRKVLSVSDNLESWDGLRKRKPFSKEKKVRAVIKVIRDALTHGNIFTFKDPIEAIIFISRNYNDENIVCDYSFIYVSSHDFRNSLKIGLSFSVNLRSHRNP